MSWSWWFCDTLTGDKLREVEPASGSWARRLNVAQSGSHVFPLTVPADRDDWRDVTTSWTRTLVQCWEDEPVYAGLVTGRSYDRASGMLTVRHTDLRSIFLARYPFGVDSYFIPSTTTPGSLTITSKSLVSAVAIVLNEGLQGPVGEADYTLPLTLPSLSDSGSFSETYENFNFRRCSDILDELQEMDGGPDVEFAPQWSGSDKLEWVTRAGALTGGTFSFDLSSSTSPVSSFQANDDGLKQVTGVFGIGSGYGTAMSVGGTPGADPYIIPARDEVVPWKMISDDTHLSALGFERIAKYRTATSQPDITVLASEVSPLDLILGSTISVSDSGNPFLLDGPTEYRLIGLSGGVGESLTLAIEEEAG